METRLNTCYQGTDDGGDNDDDGLFLVRAMIASSNMIDQPKVIKTPLQNNIHRGHT